MNEDQIDDDVCDLLRKYGPDGHVDGHEEITEYIVSLLSGSDFQCCLALLRSWCAGNGDERFVTKDHVRELVEATGEFLKKYPLEDHLTAADVIREYYSPHVYKIKP